MKRTRSEVMKQELKALIANGEKIDVELEESRNEITKDVYDTVCAFNNRDGGHIILGVDDNRNIQGIENDAIDKMLKDFTTSIKNPQKMYLPLYLIPEVVEIEPKKSIIHIFVLQGMQVRRHDGKIMDRAYEIVS